MSKYMYNGVKPVYATVEVSEMCKIMRKAMGYQSMGRYIMDAVIRDIYNRGYVLADLPKKDFDRLMKLVDEAPKRYDKIEKEAKEIHRKVVAKNRKKNARYHRDKEIAVKKALEKVRAKHGKEQYNDWQGNPEIYKHSPSYIQAKGLSASGAGTDTDTDQEKQ